MPANEGALKTLNWVNKHYNTALESSNEIDTGLLRPSHPIPVNAKTSFQPIYPFQIPLSISSDKSNDDFKNIGAYEVYEDDFIGPPANGVVDFCLSTLETTKNPYLDKMKEDLQNVDNFKNKVQQIAELNDWTSKGEPSEAQNRDIVSEIIETVIQKETESNENILDETNEEAPQNSTNVAVDQHIEQSNDNAPKKRVQKKTTKQKNNKLQSLYSNHVETHVNGNARRTSTKIEDDPSINNIGSSITRGEETGF